jgi:hypothetical protein
LISKNVGLIDFDRKPGNKMFLGEPSNGEVSMGLGTKGIPVPSWPTRVAYLEDGRKMGKTLPHLPPEFTLL